MAPTERPKRSRRLIVRENSNATNRRLHQGPLYKGEGIQSEHIAHGSSRPSWPSCIDGFPWSTENVVLEDVIESGACTLVVGIHGLVVEISRIRSATRIWSDTVQSTIWGGSYWTSSALEEIPISVEGEDTANINRILTLRGIAA